MATVVRAIVVKATVVRAIAHIVCVQNLTIRRNPYWGDRFNKARPWLLIRPPLGQFDVTHIHTVDLKLSQEQADQASPCFITNDVVSQLPTSSQHNHKSRVSFTSRYSAIIYRLVLSPAVCVGVVAGLHAIQMIF